MNIGKKLWQGFLIMQAGFLSVLIFRTFFEWVYLLDHGTNPFDNGFSWGVVIPGAGFMAALAFSMHVTSGILEDRRR